MDETSLQRSPQANDLVHRAEGLEHSQCFLRQATEPRGGHVREQVLSYLCSDDQGGEMTATTATAEANQQLIERAYTAFAEGEIPTVLPALRAGGAQHRGMRRRR